MVMSRKSDPLYFLNIGPVYPTVKGVLILPLDEMFNTVFITSAHYFIYLNLGLELYSDFNKFVIVKLAFNKTILQVWMFIN